VREDVEVKLHAEDGEMYVYARSGDRVAKERAMRLRQLRGLLRRLQELSAMTLPARELLLKLGEARERYRTAWRLLDFDLPEPVTAKERKAPARFSYRLNRTKLRKARRREGRYLLRANMPEAESADLWNFYIQLTEVEAAFKTLKDDLDLRPIYHQLDSRIEAHIFISFLAYCLHVTLRARLRPHAPGLTSRAVLDKFAAMYTFRPRTTEHSSCPATPNPRPTRKSFWKNSTSSFPTSPHLASRPLTNSWLQPPPCSEDLLITILILSAFPARRCRQLRKTG
jgi:hypothetical protein